MKKNIRNDYCIRMFVGSDTLRPAMMKVHSKNGFLYATSGTIAAKVDSKVFMHKYDNIESYPDVEKIISVHKSIEKKTIKVDSLFADLMKIECCFKPKLIECDDCEGEGYKTCDHCDSEYKCKECRGEGEVNGPDLELSGEYDCKLFNKYYLLSNLDIILKTAIILQVDEISISNSNEHGGTIFNVGDFTILLMTRMNQNN